MTTYKILALIPITAITLTIAFGPVFAQDTVTPTPTPTVTRGQARDSAREANLTKAKSMATTIFTNHFLAKLNTLRARVTANANLGDDAKQALLAKIDAEILWFTQQKDSIPNSTTLLQVRTIVREARTRFITIGKELRRLHIARGFVTSLDRVISNLEKNIVTKLDAKLAELSGKGVDVTAEIAISVTVKTEIAAAKTEVTEIRNSTTFELAKKNYDEAKAHIKNARKELKEVLQSLKSKV